ncbi:MAG: HAMP domain-containing protein [Elusimicrobia bacterium]|nr:HAMP domain-containing protein [Elusimicrobiota bacterium]
MAHLFLAIDSRLRPWLFRVGLRGRLLFIFFLSIGPAVGLIVNEHFRREKTDLEEARGLSLIAAEMAAAEYEKILDTTRQVLMTYAQIDGLRRGGRVEAEKLLRSLQPLHPRFVNVGLTDAKGALLASAVARLDRLGRGVPIEHQRALFSNGFAVGDFQNDTLTGRSVIHCVYPVVGSGGRASRLIFASLDLRGLGFDTKSFARLAGGRLILLDRQGRLLASTDPVLVPGTTPPWSEKTLRLFENNQEPKLVVEDGVHLFGRSLLRLWPNPGLSVVYDVSLEVLHRPQHRQMIGGVLSMVSALMFAGFFVSVAGHLFLTRHVGNLIVATERVSRGDMTARTGIRDEPGELGRLARAIDVMAENIGERERSLAAARGSLEEQVKERTRELEETNKELETFGYSVSHDLRAPLRAIDGFSQILLNEHAAGLTPEGRRLLGVVVKNTKHMAVLIDDLMVYSKLGRQSVMPGSIDMDELIRDLKLEFTTMQPDRTVTWDIGPLPAAWGDAGMLRQVFYNLLTNALKFTRQTVNPLVRIAGEKVDGTTRYVVRDNGVGFDSNHQRRLFQPFQRLHSAQEFEGTGVGLAIAQRVVVKHGGTIVAESQPQEGATFTVTLPVGPL